MFGEGIAPKQYFREGTALGSMFGEGIAPEQYLREGTAPGSIFGEGGGMSITSSQYDSKYCHRNLKLPMNIHFSGRGPGWLVITQKLALPHQTL